MEKKNWGDTSNDEDDDEEEEDYYSSSSLLLTKKNNRLGCKRTIICYGVKICVNYQSINMKIMVLFNKPSNQKDP